MFTRRGWLILFLVLLLAIADFFLVLNKSVNLDIVYVLMKNMLIPVFVAPSLMEQTKLSILKNPRLEWMAAGAIIGAIPTAGMLIATGVDYFLQGGSERLNAVNGINVPVTAPIMDPLIVTLVIVWLSLTVLSGFSGLASSLFFAKNLKKTSPN